MSCDDGSACTRTDTCQSGACVGSDPVVCTVDHGTASCTRATGTCTLDRCDTGYDSPDGTTCLDVPEGQCWWLHNRTFTWVEWPESYFGCKKHDGCSTGGGDTSHGGCYKWTVGQNDPFTAWPV